MSYGSDTEGGAAEGVGGDTGGNYGADSSGDNWASSNYDYSLSSAPSLDFSGIGLSPSESSYGFMGANEADYGGSDFNLNDLFGYTPPDASRFGLTEPYSMPQDYTMSNFVDSPFGKTMRGLLGMTPFGKVANIGIDLARDRPLAQIAANAIPGKLGALAQAGVRASTSTDPMASLGKSALGYGLGTLGQAVGYGIGGPIGGVLGGMAGGKVAGLSGGTPAPASPSQGGFNMGGALQGLGGLFAGYQGMKQAKQLQQNASQSNLAIQSQMAGLRDMYSPNSAYAQQLAQQLARKDAASGRNSQYGPRAVELQARLAAMAPQVANSMTTLGGAVNAGNNQALAANQAQQAAKAQMLNKLIGVGESSGFNKWAGEGLSSLFS